MKRFLIITALAVLSSASLNAQIRYLGTTNNTTTYQSTQSYGNPEITVHPRPRQYQQTPIYSTNAYYQSGNGYVKLPIKVTVDDYGNVTLKQYYLQTVVGGEWRNFGGVCRAQKCMSTSNDTLERRFMYKCMISSPEVTTIYFDL